jgi:uncharacterized protein (TIGR03437 family)
MPPLRAAAGTLIFLCLGPFPVSLFGQSGYTMNLNPATLPAGGSSFSLDVSFHGNSQEAPLPKPTWIVRWNGSLRPTHFTENNGIADVKADISSLDIATPGITEVSVLDYETGQVYPATSWFVAPVDINGVDFAYDAQRNKFYVAVPQNASRPNAPAGTVTVVDAVTGAVGPAAFFAQSPRRLVISDDQTYLYVLGSNGIYQVDLNTFTGSAYLSSTTESYFDMAVMPGVNTTLAVAHTAQGTNSGLITIYDKGVPRPEVTQDVLYNTLMFADAGDIIAGNEIFSPMQKLPVSSAGVGSATASTIANEIPVAIADGLVYAASGNVFDLGLNLVGTTGEQGTGTFVPGRSRLLALYGLGNSSPGAEIAAFDEQTLEPLGDLAFPATPVAAFFPAPAPRLIAWGNDGLAFLAQTEGPATSVSQLVIAQTPLAGPAPVFAASSAVNAATLVTGDVAPGEILSVFGSNLGPALGRTLEFSAPHQVSSLLDGTEVWFDGLSGIMLYAGSGQVNVVAPFGLAGRSTTKVQLVYGGIPSAAVILNVATTAPGIFTQNGTGTGLSAILNADGGLNTAMSPAHAGDVVSLFGTGGGVTSPPSEDGVPAVAANSLAAPVEVLLNNQSITPTYAGSAPGLVAGVIQVNFQIPAGLPSSTPVRLQLKIGGVTSPASTTMVVQ